MTWGTFGTTHIVTLVLAALINIVLYFVLKNRKSLFFKDCIYVEKRK